MVQPMPRNQSRIHLFGVLLACALGMSGCEKPPPDPEDADVEVEDDAGSTTEEDLVTSEDADAGPALDVPGPECPGGPTCVCTANDDCDSGVCIEGPGGKECAATCVDNCEGDFICVLVSSGGGDDINVCVHARGRLCDPCATSKDCILPGHGQATCVDHGTDGSFCGTLCTVSEECPKGYGCQEVTSVEGAKVSQCVRLPDPGSDSKAGSCPCSEWAVKGALQTDCFILSKDAEGNVVGQCPGIRKCGEEGLSACLAPDPVPEICDGIDSDCNGKTDEGTCEDDNVCTKDACDPSLAVDGQEGCTHKPVAVKCDADSTACTAGDNCQGVLCDICVDGMCIPGPKVDCDDGNPCTKDSCDEKEGCKNPLDDGAPCDDGQKCTVNDACKAGKCMTGTPKDCDSGSPCVDGNCDPNAGGCVFEDKQDGLGCSDNHACTKLDTCQNGKCKGKLVNCDDGNVCTDNECDEKLGCQQLSNLKSCDDGNACTEGDKCSQGSCKGNKLKCDDNNPCTSETCSTESGCKSTFNTLPCNADDNACTVGDNCANGACITGKPKKCVDDSTCTIDSCDKAKGNCVFAGASKEGLDCDADDSVCTVADKCKGGVCVPGKSKNCDDSNPCTDDQCHPKKGCQNVANVAPCNADDNACTAKDSCKDGSCKVGQDKICNDKNGCTTDSCNIKTGLCEFDGQPHEGAVCDADGSECTENDQCKKGKCTPGKPKGCADGNPCTDDGCKKGGGCIFNNNTDPCDDGQKCTVGDKCKAGKCSSGTMKSCDDKNGCTQDACNIQSGKCAYNGVPFEGSPCDADGSICTQADKCVSGKCTPGKLLKCDDGNPCTTDACDPQNACKFTPNNEKCDDGDACTIDDVCLKEKCIAKPKSCDDGNACTTDTCDKKKGCAHAEDLNLKLCGKGKVCYGNTCKATVCGDGIVHKAVEKCDGANVVANNCDTVLGNGSFGSLSCAKDCLTFDTSKCTDLGWMERSDDCNGFRQSTMHPGVRFAVAKDTTWVKAKVYPCPKGYSWMTTAKAKQTFKGGGTKFTYYNQCDWYAGQWKGKERKYFRFKDSASTLAFKHSYYYEGQPIDYGKFTEHFAGIVCLKD